MGLSDFRRISPRRARRGRLDVGFLRVEPTFDLGYEVVDHEPLDRPDAERPCLTSREAMHPREFAEIFIGGSKKATGAARLTRTICAAPGRIKLDHGVDSSRRLVPGCVHARLAIMPALCEECAAMVRGQTVRWRVSAHDRFWPWVTARQTLAYDLKLFLSRLEELRAPMPENRS